MSTVPSIDQKPALVYHIAEPDVWRQVGDLYIPAAFAREGFVHLSTRGQVLATAGRYYAGRDDLLLLELDVKALDEHIIYENLLGGGEMFPHYYAPIPRAAVIGCETLCLAPDGSFSCSLLET